MQRQNLATYLHGFLDEATDVMSGAQPGACELRAPSFIVATQEMMTASNMILQAAAGSGRLVGVLRWIPSGGCRTGQSFAGKLQACTFTSLAQAS